jgi:hypothetical protein
LKVIYCVIEQLNILGNCFNFIGVQLERNPVLDWLDLGLTFKTLNNAVKKTPFLKALELNARFLAIWWDSKWQYDVSEQSIS